MGYRKALHRKVFLGSLVKKMSRPKARNDELSYLSTQVVFEYLRLRFGEQVDGLVFPSVQTGEAGTNVVLFPEASRLAYILPAGAERTDLATSPHLSRCQSTRVAGSSHPPRSWSCTTLSGFTKSLRLRPGPVSIITSATSS